jgi:hypothetical protein
VIECQSSFSLAPEEISVPEECIFRESTLSRIPTGQIRASRRIQAGTASFHETRRDG